MVIDGCGDTVIATVAAGDHPIAFCYGRRPTNKVLHAASDYSDSVSPVIDGRADTDHQDRGHKEVGPAPPAINPTNHKVYCANYELNLWW